MSDRDDLCEILVDSGAEIIPEINFDSNTRIYAIRKIELGDFVINSNIDSKIIEYKSKIAYNMVLAILMLLLAIYFFCINIFYRIEILSLIMGVIELVCGISSVINTIKYSIQLKNLQEEREIGE